MENTRKNSVDGYQWKKFASTDSPAMLAWVIGNPPVTQHEPSPPEPSEIGYEDGFAQGFSAGQAEALTKQKDLITQLENMLHECQILKQRQRDESLVDAASVLQQLFAVLFDYELQISDALLQALVREMGHLLGTDGQPRIHMSPQDYENLAALMSADMEELIVVEDTLPKGVVRASFGQSLIELDVVKNLQEVLSAGAGELTSAQSEGGAMESVDE